MKGLNINNDFKISEVNQKEKNYELIHASIERLLFSEIGSMVGELNRGSRILDYFYEPATINTAMAILREAKMILENYESRLGFDFIGIGIIPSDETSSLIIYMEGFLNEDPDEKISLEFIKVKEV